MSLRDTEEKLYEPSSDIEKRQHSSSEFDLDENKNAGKSFLEEKTWWDKFRFNWLSDEKRLAIYTGTIILGLIIFFSFVFVGVVKFKETAFSENRVIVSVEGADVIPSAKETKYVIKYKNNNRVSLEDAEIIFNHSENFYPEPNEKIKIENDRNIRISLGKIRAFSGGEIEITGKFYAAEDYMVYLQPTLKYKAENFNSFFEATSQYGVRITSSSVELSIKTPKEATDESTIDYEIGYENKEGVTLNDLSLKIEYPEGLIYQDGTPRPVGGDNVWYLGNLTVGAKGIIKLKSKVDGQQYDTKIVRVTVYKNENGGKEVVYGKAEEVIKIVVPPLSVDLKVNGKNDINVNLGNELRYIITYSNRGDIGLKDVIIKLKLDSPIINYPEINLVKGAYNSATKDFTWKVVDEKELKRLEPGESGQVEVIVPIKKDIDIKNANDKNYVIEAVATIDSSDIAYHSLGTSKNISSTVFAKLNSKVIFQKSMNYDDADIKNYGPTPWKIGEETTYAVDWKLKNVSNTVSDIKVYAVIPTWAIWKGVTFPQGEKITFNDRTHEIIWDVGTLENGLGILNNPKEVKFQIGMIPEINQDSRDLKLTQDVRVIGKDDFTGEKVELIFEEQ